MIFQYAVHGWWLMIFRIFRVPDTVEGWSHEPVDEYIPVNKQIAIENPAFSWNLPGKMVNFHGYVG